MSMEASSQFSNLSDQPTSPLTDFGNFSDEKGMCESQNSTAEDVCSNFTGENSLIPSRFNQHDHNKPNTNSFNIINDSQFIATDDVTPSILSEKNSAFQINALMSGCIKLPPEKDELPFQEKSLQDDRSNAVGKNINPLLHNAFLNQAGSNFVFENATNRFQDTIPDSTRSRIVVEKRTTETLEIISDSEISKFIKYINTNQSQNTSTNTIYPGLTVENNNDRTLGAIPGDIYLKKTEAVVQYQNVSPEKASSSTTEDEVKKIQHQDNAPESSSSILTDEKICIQPPDNISNNTTYLSESKVKVARANKLLLPVLPPAEEFVYSPEIYNEEYLLKTYPKTFKTPHKIDVLTLSSEELIEAIEKTCVSQGEPLVIQNFHKLEGFDSETFSLNWLKNAYFEKEVRVRDLKAKQDVTLSFKEFLSSVEDVPYSDIRYYGKDLECPLEWETASKKFLPDYLQYMGPTDLNGLLDERLKIDNLMIYVGHEGTHTATHFDMCGSVGHNLMVQADEGCSALWFMVAQDDANKARKFWHSYGGGNTTIDQDNCILPAHIMGLAEFPIYTFQQALGDFVIVPSETPHQVVNIGKGCTIKFSWNRNTATSLSHCINSVLLVNRRILKMETYRTKTMVEQGVIQWGKMLEETKLSFKTIQDRERFCRDYRILLNLYAKIISSDVVDSSYKPIVQRIPKISTDPYPHSRVCDFCRCDIWNNWFHCDKCPFNKKLGIYGHDLCVDCFAENRKCLNFQELVWFCHRPIKKCINDLVKFSKLFNNYNLFLGLSSHQPVPILSDFKCFENLHPEVFSPITLAVKINDHYKMSDHHTCHQCVISRFHADMVKCSTCVRSFCHGCISNRYANNPFELALRKGWQCFYCVKKCNCAKCARKFGEENVTPLPPNPFCLKDFYENYFLGYGLTYFPVGASKILVPNVVDFQTFLGRKKGMDKATDPKVIANLIPYIRPVGKTDCLSINTEDNNSIHSEVPEKEGIIIKSKAKRKLNNEEAPKKPSKKIIAAVEPDASSKDSFEAVEKVLLNSVGKKSKPRNQIVSDKTTEGDEENPVLLNSGEKKPKPRKRIASNRTTEGDEDDPVLSNTSLDIKPPKKRGRPRKLPLPLTNNPDVKDSTLEKAAHPGEESNSTESQPKPDFGQMSLKNDSIEKEILKRVASAGQVKNASESQSKSNIVQNSLRNGLIGNLISEKVVSADEDCKASKSQLKSDIEQKSLRYDLIKNIILEKLVSAGKDSTASESQSKYVIEQKSLRYDLIENVVLGKAVSSSKVKSALENQRISDIRQISFKDDSLENKPFERNEDSLEAPSLTSNNLELNTS